MDMYEADQERYAAHAAVDRLFQESRGSHALSGTIKVEKHCPACAYTASAECRYGGPLDETELVARYHVDAETRDDLETHYLMEHSLVASKNDEGKTVYNRAATIKTQEG